MRLIRSARSWDRRIFPALSRSGGRDDLEGPRVLVARQPISEVPSHLVEIQVRRGLDDGVHALAEVVVGQPDDGAGGDAGMRLKHRLDLGRVDVLAAGLHGNEKVYGLIP